MKGDTLRGDPDDTSVDTEHIRDYESIIMKEESYRKVKNQNLLSHKEIKELTIFMKNPPIKIFDKLSDMKDHVRKLGKIFVIQIYLNF